MVILVMPIACVQKYVLNEHLRNLFLNQQYKFSLFTETKL